MNFLLTINNGQGVIEVARTIKMKDELLKERIVEKFKIEREYWHRKEIDWGIVTEEEVPKTMARNISYIHDYYDIRDYDVFREINAQYIEDLSISLMQSLLGTNESIRKITNEFDKDTHFPFDRGVTLFYHYCFLWHKRFPILASRKCGDAYASKGNCRAFVLLYGFRNYETHSRRKKRC